MKTLTWSDGSLWLPLGLIPATTAVSISVTSGQALIVTGSSAVTATLPTHAAGQLCAVLNRSTGGTTVSGTSIQGVGLSSASSFPLGTVGAGAVLLDDGTSWNLIAGQQDTGWVTLTLQPNIGVAATYYTPAARLRGDVTTLKGAMQNNTGSTIAGGTVWGAVPASPSGLRPTGQIVVPSLDISGSIFGFQATAIGTNGVIAPEAGAASGGIVPLDGISYSIS